MLQGICKKISIDFLNHAIPSEEHQCFRFWGVSWILRWWWWFIFSLTVGQFSLFITWLISFIFEDVTSVLIKCVFSSGCAWTTLSICISFTLLFCFANFVNWRSLSDWMGFEVVHIQVSRGSSFFFRNVVEFQTFTLAATFAFTRVSSGQRSNDIVSVSFTSSLKKSISLLSEEV